MKNKQIEDRVALAGKLSIVANRTFLSDYRGLLVSFDREGLSASLLAWIRLHCATEILDGEPGVQLYLRIQERAFLTLLDRDAIVPVAEITSLGKDALDEMRQRTGIGVESILVPESVLTLEQKLEQQVRTDWKSLSSAKVRQQINNDKAYRSMFQRLSETDALASSPATTFVRIPEA
jgi:hypothetical protein